MKSSKKGLKQMKFLKSKKLRLFLKIAVSTILIILVLRFVGLVKIYNELLNVNIPYLILATIISLIVIVLKSIRWKNIIKIFEKDLNLKDSIRYTLISIAFGRVTPSTVGEFIKVKFLKDQTGINYLKSFITVVIDKGFDLIAMTLIALLGFSLLKDLTNFNTLITFLFILYILILISIFIFFPKVMKIASFFLPKKYKESFNNIKFTKKIYLNSLLISIGSWIILSVEALFVLKALGVSVSFFVTLSVIPLMALAAIVPISLGGVGVRELIAIYFLLLIGIDVEKSAAFSLLYTFTGAGIPALIGAALHIFYKKKPQPAEIERNI
tara:strand:+ start:1003 stop:1980 length:978 start_codon:yes stop_codon:yes gene_type:complete